MLGAGNGARTRDLNLGKVALYQLSYSRIHISILPLITQGVTLYSAKGGQASELFPHLYLNITINNETSYALPAKGGQASELFPLEHH
jgi:hypothetical protein